MQSPFPTKKFFFVLLFLVLAGSGVFKLFEYFQNRNAQNAIEEQRLAVIQNEVLLRQGTEDIVITPAMEQRVATSTKNTIAAVVYLNQQTKENGATMEQITALTRTQIQTSINKLGTDTYAKSDIVTSDDNTPEALKKYGNTMMGIFIYYGKSLPPTSTLEIIKRGLEKNDKKELTKLDPFIEFYKNIIKISLLTSVPSSAISVHLNIINSYAEKLALLQSFRMVYDDLPSAIASNSRLEKSAIRFLDSMRGADAFFKEKGVAFLSDNKEHFFEITTKLVTKNSLL